MEKFRGMMNPGDSLVRTIQFQLTDERNRPRRYLTKSQMMILDLLNNMDWDRPVYFAVTTGNDAYLGLEPYFQLEGLAYRLTPIYHKRSKNPYVDGGVNADIMYENMMTKFQWGNMDKANIYMDENNRRMSTNLRLQFSHLAQDLIEKGDVARGVQALDKCLSVIPEQVAPFEQPQILWRLAELYYDANENAKGTALAQRLVELNNQEIAYFKSLDQARQDVMEQDLQMRVQLNDRVIERVLKTDPQNAVFIDLKNQNEETMKELGFEVQTKRAPVQKPQMVKDSTKPAGAPEVKKDTVSF
jgi:tetratricopeptide (TPR) repeat protein